MISVDADDDLPALEPADAASVDATFAQVEEGRPRVGLARAASSGGTAELALDDSCEAEDSTDPSRQRRRVEKQLLNGGDGDREAVQRLLLRAHGRERPQVDELDRHVLPCTWSFHADGDASLDRSRAVRREPEFERRRLQPHVVRLCPKGSGTPRGSAAPSRRSRLKIVRLG